MRKKSWLNLFTAPSLVGSRASPSVLYSLLHPFPAPSLPEDTLNLLLTTPLALPWPSHNLVAPCVVFTALPVKFSLLAGAHSAGDPPSTHFPLLSYTEEPNSV